MMSHSVYISKIIVIVIHFIIYVTLLIILSKVKGELCCCVYYVLYYCLKRSILVNGKNGVWALVGKAVVGYISRRVVLRRKYFTLFC